MVELTYQGVDETPQIYTTSVFITPDEAPFELEHKVRLPKSDLYWSHQVDSVVSGNPDEISYHELTEMLPFFVLGEQVNDVDRLAELLEGPDAMQNCTTARLNVEAGELGWYTSVHDGDENRVKYWQVYDLAERIYAHDYKESAAILCRDLTRLFSQ
jgi:hypothetical protein